MTFSRKLMAGGVFVVLGVVAACGKSSDDDAGSAGKGGSSGSSGKGGSGTGGSSGGTKASGGMGGTTGGTGATGGTKSTGGTSSETAGAAGEDTAGSGGTGAGGTGGTMSTSGSGGTGDPVAIDTMCPAFKACGGDVVGNWRLTTLCGTNGGAAGAAGAGAGGAPGTAGVPECASKTAMSMGSSDAVYDFKADGTYSIKGSLTLKESFTIDDACAKTFSVPDAATFCGLANSGLGAALGFDFTCQVSGADCGCAIMSSQAQDETGTYTLDGDQVTIVPKSGSSGIDTAGTSDYCVKGQTTITLQSSSGSGQVVLTRP
jgi:hypothetical protein